MKITIKISIVCPNNWINVSLSKKYDTELVPMIGMEFEDVAFNQPKKIINISIRPEDDEYFVYLGSDEGNSTNDCQQIVEMYESHDWKRCANTYSDRGA